MKTACLSYIEGTNYDFLGICVTFKSLREHYQENIIVLYKDVDQKLLNFFKSQQIEAIDCSSYKVTYNTSPYNNKIIYTYLFLKKNVDRFKKSVLLFCDISDVYFKCNPFELYKDKLIVFCEDLTFDQCNTNKIWASVCYGDTIFNKIKDKIVINSGIILANFEDLLNCFKLMLEDMSQILARVNYPTTDQIILNKLIYIDQLEACVDSQNVNNMAQKIKTKADNKINHQYKVFPELKKELYTIYAE